MDYIPALPLAAGSDAIEVHVDRLTKLAHFTAAHTSWDSKDAATSYVKNIFRLHGAPTTITSDRGPQFVAKFWKEFHKLLDTKAQLSTARHPQTDGQLEILNQILE